MPAKKTAGGTGTAALREAKSEAPTVEWKGLTLELPVKAPGVIALDMAELQSITESGGNPMGTVHRIFQSLLGEEQLRAVRAAIAESGVPLDEMVDTLRELLEDTMTVYGLAPGESKASD